MNKSAKLMIAGAVLSIAVATPAMGATSANVGLMSEYIFRGVVQNPTATANGGLDFERDGFYVGTWAADVGLGLEVDIYGGYSHEFEGGFSLGAGFTGYYYTDDFDDTYQEINITGAYEIISFEYSVGEYDNFGPDLDYSFAAVTIEKNGFYGKYGTWGKDLDDAYGDYLEAGYGTEIGGFDAGVSIIRNSVDEYEFVFTIGKSFDLN